MKKILCVILSMVLLLSSVSVLSFAAEEETTTKKSLSDSISGFVSDKINAEQFRKALQAYTFNDSDIPSGYKTDGKFDMEKLINSSDSDAKNTTVYGLSVDFLYHRDEKLYWGSLPCASEPYCSTCKKYFKADELSENYCPECGATLTVETIYNTIAIVCGNLNSFLKKTLVKLYGGQNLYTSENATRICNYIGKLLYPNYSDRVIVFPNPIVESKSNDFYDTIAKESGMLELVEKNWCNNYDLNVKPLLSAFGVSMNNFPVIDRDTHNAVLVSRCLIKAIVENTLEKGPVEYFLGVLSTFVQTYTVSLYAPIRALFNLKVANGTIDEYELKTFKGFLNLVFNDNNPNDESKFWFITPPMRKFNTAENKVELFLYVAAYLALVGKHGSNPSVAANLKADIVANTVLDETEKERCLMIVDGLFGGQLREMGASLAIVTVEDISTIKDNIWQRFTKMIKGMIQRFIDFFDKIYQNFKNFGK